LNVQDPRHAFDGEDIPIRFPDCDKVLVKVHRNEVPKIGSAMQVLGAFEKPTEFDQQSVVSH
jgi:hypothetical protein